MSPEDNRRLSVYPQVEVEATSNVCPPGPLRDAGDQDRDGRVIWAGSRSKPPRQSRAEVDASIPVMAMAHQRTRALGKQRTVWWFPRRKAPRSKTHDRLSRLNRTTAVDVVGPQGLEPWTNGLKPPSLVWEAAPSPRELLSR